jgi:hypothetical protein
MKLINRLLARFGLWLVPAGSTAKMLHEDANVVETRHPSGSVAAAWLRRVADWVD